MLSKHCAAIICSRDLLYTFIADFWAARGGSAWPERKAVLENEFVDEGEHKVAASE